MNKNKVTLVVSQHIPAYVNSKGNAIDAFENVVEFNSETAMEVSVENVASWTLCQLKKYMSIKRLQGKTGFKLSKDITMQLKVNNKTESVESKFSLNEDRLRKIFERTPKLLAAVFALAPNIGGLTQQKALNFIFNEGKLLLAAAKKEGKDENTDENNIELKALEEKTEVKTTAPAETVPAIAE